MEVSTVERYGFLDEIKPGMMIWIDSYSLGRSGWMVVTDRRDSVMSPMIGKGPMQDHVKLVGQFDDDGAPARTEGWGTNTIRIRETTEASS